jgi:hypothetical protein
MSVERQRDEHVQDLFSALHRQTDAVFLKPGELLPVSELYSIAEPCRSPICLFKFYFKSKRKPGDPEYRQYLLKLYVLKYHVFVEGSF